MSSFVYDTLGESYIKTTKYIHRPAPVEIHSSTYTVTRPSYTTYTTYSPSYTYSVEPKKSYHYASDEIRYPYSSTLSTSYLSRRHDYGYVPPVSATVRSARTYIPYPVTRRSSYVSRPVSATYIPSYTRSYVRSYTPVYTSYVRPTVTKTTEYVVSPTVVTTATAVATPVVSTYNAISPLRYTSYCSSPSVYTFGRPWSVGYDHIQSTYPYGSSYTTRLGESYVRTVSSPTRVVTESCDAAGAAYRYDSVVGRLSNVLCY